MNVGFHHGWSAPAVIDNLKHPQLHFNFFYFEVCDNPITPLSLLKSVATVGYLSSVGDLHCLNVLRSLLTSKD